MPTTTAVDYRIVQNSSRFHTAKLGQFVTELIRHAMDAHPLDTRLIEIAARLSVHQLSLLAFDDTPRLEAEQIDSLLEQGPPPHAFVATINAPSFCRVCFEETGHACHGENQ